MRGFAGRAAGIALILTAVWAGTAEAKTYEVNKLGDPDVEVFACTPSHCSLREAVAAANARPGADRIVLPKAKRYALTRIDPPEDGNLSGDLDISDSLVIVHPGRGRATIDAAGAGERAIHGFAPLVLKKLVLTGGEDLAGGAVQAAERTRIARSVLRGNESNGVGGAVDLEGDAKLKVTRSVFRGNRAGTTAGAIRDGEEGGEITISRSRFIGNRATTDGGAIRFSDTGGTIARSSFAGNVAGGDGGAIQTDLENPLAIRRSSLTGNQAGEGGAIEASGAGQLRIVSSTVSGNFANGDDGGGGLYTANGAITVRNSTFAGNRANSAGGGIAAIASLVSLNATTIVRNIADFNDNQGIATIGGGIYGDAADRFTVRNSIIALNRDATVGNDCARPDAVDSLGHNLISTDLGCLGFDGPQDRVRANPKLGALKRNGGPTKTVALRRGSPAIGKAHRPSAPDRDQRGRKRDRRPDIGAFERGA